jgi:hypothetical protein
MSAALPDRLLRLLAVLILLTLAGVVRAQSGSTEATAPIESRGDEPAARWVLSTSVYTRHFHPSPDHNNHQRLLSAERIRDDGRLIGLAFFRNSFDQPSTLAFVGQRWDSTERLPGAYLKLIGGFLHGYKGEYRDKIPFNRFGIAPVVIPSVGWQYGRGAIEMVLFGNSGVMWTVGYTFR